MVSILPDGNAPEIARRLLEAAGDQPDLVTIDTSGTRTGFSVPDEIAIKAGFMKAPAKPKATKPATDKTAAEKGADQAEPDKPAEKAPAKTSTSASK